MKLQEYLNQKYPTREDKEKVRILSASMNKETKTYPGFIGYTGSGSPNNPIRTPVLEGKEIDLSEFVNLEEIILEGGLSTSLLKEKIEKIKLGQNNKLRRIELNDNRLTSVDFLNTIPNPEKLEVLRIYNNNIKPTNIEVFSKFINLRDLKIGTIRN
jgi:hypothetical protein